MEPEGSRSLKSLKLDQGDVSALISCAKQQLLNVPISAARTHTVCGAVMSHDRRMFSGISLAHFTGGPCGEPVAIANAAGAGVLSKDLICCVAVKRMRPTLENLLASNNKQNSTTEAEKRATADDYHADIPPKVPSLSTESAMPDMDDMARMKVLNPCGRCRQQLLDLNPDIQVIVIDEAGVEKVVGIQELLPYAYYWNASRKQRAIEGPPEKMESSDGVATSETGAGTVIHD